MKTQWIAVAVALLLVATRCDGTGLTPIIIIEKNDPKEDLLIVLRKTHATMLAGQEQKELI
ncbi:MAG: hypothetical protein KAV00_17280 [Phycisphaerae bacterium]|nr:hypothetical protein [Phycisphaerae bacterium]